MFLLTVITHIINPLSAPGRPYVNTKGQTIHRLPERPTVEIDWFRSEHLAMHGKCGCRREILRVHGNVAFLSGCSPNEWEVVK